MEETATLIAPRDPALTGIAPPAEASAPCEAPFEEDRRTLVRKRVAVIVGLL